MFDSVKILSVLAFRKQGRDSDYEKAFDSVKTLSVKKAFRRQDVDSRVRESISFS